MSENKYKEFNGDVTPEQIELWKSNGRVMSVTITDDDLKEKRTGYFKRPTMATMQAANATGKNDELKGSEIMFDNCWLGGDPMLKEDAILKMDAMSALGTLFGRTTKELKNL